MRYDTMRLALPLLLAAARLVNLPSVAGLVVPSRPSAGSRLAAKPAASREQDLELTRKLLLKSLNQPAAKQVRQPSTTAAKPSTTPTASLNGNGSAGKAETNGKHASTEDSATSALFFLKDRPTNDLLLRAAKGLRVSKTPVWLFRQAGRHLPEYEAYKRQIGMNFWQMLSLPSAVVECTMQPLRRYKDLDAAILFSDILVLPAALGMRVTMPGGVGIQVPDPLQTPADMRRRLPAAANVTPRFVQDKLGYVVDSVRLIRTQMQVEGHSVPLIGFSAAPWTLMFYMVGGSSKKNPAIGVEWLQKYPQDSQYLLDLLTALVVEYTSAQIEAGAHLVQIFEAMGMMIDEEHFEKYAMPCLARIAAELNARHADVPLMVFARGACYMNDRLAKLGYNVITMDGSVDRKTIRDYVADDNGRDVVSLQGNYDPAELIEANGKTAESVRATARQMLQELGPQRLIANLGEGLGGKESPALVQEFIRAIHEESAAMIKAGKAKTANDTEATSGQAAPMFFASASS
jgi:uroporphyrinogen decarboxylase